MSTTNASYAEIGVTSNFSFLYGASHPQEYVHQAGTYGFAAIGIADRNTLAGIVRAYAELKNPELTFRPKLLVGSRLVFSDGTPDILAYPQRPAGLRPALPPAQQGQIGCGERRVRSAVF